MQAQALLDLLTTVGNRYLQPGTQVVMGTDFVYSCCEQMARQTQLETASAGHRLMRKLAAATYAAPIT